MFVSFTAMFAHVEECGTTSARSDEGIVQSVQACARSGRAAIHEIGHRPHGPVTPPSSQPPALLGLPRPLSRPLPCPFVLTSCPFCSPEPPSDEPPPLSPSLPASFFLPPPRP